MDEDTARAWLAGAGVTDEDEDDDGFAVWPENWDALQLFLALATQWRHAGLAGVPTGLDYAAVPVTARLMAMRVHRDTFDRLRLLEAAALAVLRQRWSRDG